VQSVSSVSVGSTRSELYHLNKMNKFLVVASSLVAAVYGEAEPQLLTAPYAYGLHTFGGKSAPCVNGANVPVPCAGAPLAYSGYPYAPVAYGKRDADAEPEADAAAFYGAYGYPHAFGYAHGLGYAGYHGLGYAGLGYAGLGHAVVATPAGLTHSSNVGICTNYLGASVPCGRKKRDADADADAEAAVLYGGYGYPYGYHGLGYAGLGYAGLGYAGLGYGGVAATNAALGHAVAYTPYGATHSANVGVCTNYLGAQVPC